MLLGHDLLKDLLLACAFSLLVGCDSGAQPEAVESSAVIEPSAGCPAPACSRSAQQNLGCEDGDGIQLGKYRVLNNLWGVSFTDSGAQGQQCIWSVCEPSPAIAWGTSFRWLGGPPSQVESYSAVILGWHFSSIPPDSGLPVQLSDNRNVTCSWSYRLTREGSPILNVAYDLWLGSSPDTQSPTDEIMIWLHHSGANPIGSFAQTVEVGGATWRLYRGNNNNAWDVYSFLRSETAACATLNLTDFLSYLVERFGLDSSKYLLGIEAGTEVFSGQGQLDTEHYSCEIQ